MTHASWNNERGRPSGPGHDNERLEYLGDAVLELVVGEYLFKRFPGYDEGQLTQLRAALVNTSTLARLAERLQLGEALYMGRGAAKTGARQLPSLLANAFEAMIGAIFLDQGYRVATRVFLQNIGDLTEWSDENFKGKLQEVAQERTGTTPTYRVVATGGPGHKREYTADAIVGGEAVGSGRGTTKQAAEQAAARAALQVLTKQPRRRAAAAAGTRAAGAARQAERRSAGEPARVRRRVAEVAAEVAAEDRDAPSRRQRAEATGPASPDVADVFRAAGPQQRRRGLLAALRSAAEALVGRVVPPETVEEQPPRREVRAESLPPSRPAEQPGRAAGTSARRRGGAQPPAGVIPGDGTTARPPRARRAASTGGEATGTPSRSRRPKAAPRADAPSTAPPARQRARAKAKPPAGSAPGAPADADAPARRATRRGRRGGRGRRRPNGSEGPAS
jgi:ribonuclease III